MVLRNAAGQSTDLQACCKSTYNQLLLQSVYHESLPPNARVTSLNQRPETHKLGTNKEKATIKLILSRNDSQISTARVQLTNPTPQLLTV
jgi:hypothetical protein